MSDAPIDILLDNADYTTLPESILRDIAAKGDKKAAAELERRLSVEILGPEVEDTSPIAERSDETLIAQIANGDEGAEAEYLKRHG